ncbi:MAG: arylsulfatase A, partial [Saprospiraceae bacterium]
AVGPNIRAGRVSESLVSGLDFLPTFAELSGYKGNMPDEIDGGSLVPLLLNENLAIVERSSESLIFHQSSHRPPRTAIRKGNFKLIKYWKTDSKYKNTPKVELFDLKNDIGETSNLLEKYPDLATELETEIIQFLNEVNAETGNREIDGAFYRLKNDLSKN